MKNNNLDDIKKRLKNIEVLNSEPSDRPSTEEAKSEMKVDLKSDTKIETKTELKQKPRTNIKRAQPTPARPKIRKNNKQVQRDGEYEVFYPNSQLKIRRNPNYRQTEYPELDLHELTADEANLQWSLDRNILIQHAGPRPYFLYASGALLAILVLIFLYLSLFNSPSDIAKRLDNLQKQKAAFATTTSETKPASSEAEVTNSANTSVTSGDKAAVNSTTTQTQSAEEQEFAEYDYYVEPGTFLLRPVADAPSKVVFMTFDDAPDGYAVDMAKLLKQEGVPAVFLVNGHFLYTDAQKARLKEIYDMGFQIGNHTMTHPHLLELSRQEQKQQIFELTEMIKDITGEPPRLFRPPFGEFDDEIGDYVHQDGMVLMGWTFGFDWEEQYTEASALADIMTDNPYLKDGANLLMHDREWTYKALPTIIERYREMGYGFVDPAKVMPYAVAKKFFKARNLYND